MSSATAPRCTRRQVRQRQEWRRQSGSIAIQAARVKAGQKRPRPTSSAKRTIRLRLRLRRRVTHATGPVIQPGAPTRYGRCLRPWPENPNIGVVVVGESLKLLDEYAAAVDRYRA